MKNEQLCFYKRIKDFCKAKLLKKNLLGYFNKQSSILYALG